VGVGGGGVLFKKCIKAHFFTFCRLVFKSAMLKLLITFENLDQRDFNFKPANFYKQMYFKTSTTTFYLTEKVAIKIFRIRKFL